MSKLVDLTALRLKRQCFNNTADSKKYDTLFRYMSPVQTVFWTEPGQPPHLPLHADFDDYSYNQRRRAMRDILKIRFSGCVAYAAKEDLELFACLYKKEIDRYSDVQFEIMRLIEQEGPMNIGLMKEYTKLLVKEITPALHRLQEAFIMYEDQVDNEGDRSWYLLENEFSEIDLNKYTKQEALKKLLPQFSYLNVFFNESMAKSFYKLPGKLIKEALAALIEEKILVKTEVEGSWGYMLSEDFESFIDCNNSEIPKGNVPAVLLIQKNDFMVRSNAEDLKQRFTSKWDTLYYILLDGNFHGAVMGKFKFGPHIIEDIVLDLTEKDARRRKAEILEAVSQVFDPNESPVKRFMGGNI